MMPVMAAVVGRHTVLDKLFCFMHKYAMIHGAFKKDRQELIFIEDAILRAINFYSTVSDIAC